MHPSEALRLFLKEKEAQCAEAVQREAGRFGLLAPRQRIRCQLAAYATLLEDPAFTDMPPMRFFTPKLFREAGSRARSNLIRVDYFCRNHGIATMGAFMRLTRTEILKSKNMGKRTLASIEQCLSHVGLALNP